jgi:hypothetical protein
MTTLDDLKHAINSVPPAPKGLKSVYPLNHLRHAEAKADAWRTYAMFLESYLDASHLVDIPVRDFDKAKALVSEKLK